MSPTNNTGWPALRVADWEQTRDTVHIWTQIVGKIRLSHAPLINHWWQVTLYVSPRGLTTSAIPCSTGLFDIEFDFIDHVLRIRSNDGRSTTVALAAKPVAEFYIETLSALDRLGIQTQICARPNEVEPAIPFADDRRHASYDPQAAYLFWQQLIQANRVIGQFRSYFVGKVSPVHFFWGSFDLACTRFSGRPACPDWVIVEAYSQEVSSCGFWPGDVCRRRRPRRLGPRHTRGQPKPLATTTLSKLSHT